MNQVEMEIGKVYKLVNQGLAHEIVTYVRLLAQGKLKVFCPWQKPAKQVRTAYWMEKPTLEINRGLQTFYDKRDRSTGWGIGYLISYEEVTGDDIPEEMRT